MPSVARHLGIGPAEEFAPLSRARCVALQIGCVPAIAAFGTPPNVPR